MRFFWAVLTIGFSFLLYCTFGILCAVGYKALQGEFFEASLESSPVLYDFLVDDTKKEAVFTQAELQNGLVNIMFKQASKNTKVGEAVVLTAVPVVIVDKDLIVAVPIILNSVFGRIECNLLFEYNCSASVMLKNVRIGKAKMPKVLGRFIADIVYAHYSESFGDVLDDIDALQINLKDGKVIVCKK